MHVFSLDREQQWDPKHHVEKILGRVADGDVTVACWEPGQVSPYHCHPHATEIYFCFSGGGIMRTPKETIAVTPGSFVVHPPGEVHEYENGTAHAAVPRALRLRHALAPLAVAEQQGVETVGGGRRVLPRPSGPVAVTSSAAASSCRSIS
jgi:quercetin dioxygenase-like cupin family protein